MFELDGSPRSSKRRKLVQYQSKNATSSHHVLRKLDQETTRVSRQHSESTHSSAVADNVVSHNDPDSFIDSACHSKENSMIGDTMDIRDQDVSMGDSDQIANPDNVDGNTNMTPTKRRRGRRKQHRPSTEENNERRRDDKQEEAGQQEKVPEESEKEETPILATTRSSGRERKKPRRYSHDMAEAVKAKQPAGILTPSKRKSGRPRKSVAFESSAQNNVEDDLGFRDVSSLKRKKRGATTGGDDGEGSSDQPMSRDIDLVESTGIDTLDGLLEIREGIATASYGFEETSFTDNLGRSMDEFPTYVSYFRNYCRDNQVDDVWALKDFLFEKLTGKRRVNLIGLDEEYRKVHQLVQQTVAVGESNSMLILGSRGSGKTSMVENILSALAKDHTEDFHVIRLDGHTQTDDRLALREIWRQLGREIDVEEDAGKVISYADTMASLLALLAHPEELSGAEAGITAKSIVFVMDEFDLFASHPRQTLLYNLFDIAQARKAPVAVLGLTTKVDIVEHLEKRVKSRFSHRYVHLSLPKSFVMFSEICRARLSIEAPELQEFDELLSSRDDRPKASSEVMLKGWRQFIKVGSMGLRCTRKILLRTGADNPQDLFEDEIFTTLLKRIYYRTKSVPDFISHCLVPIASLDLSNIPYGRLFMHESLAPPESKLHMLPGLSDLELGLLIAAARLDIILGTDTCNFNMAYHEYQRIASQSKIQSSASGAAAVGAGSKIWNRELSLGAWEKLGEAELLVPAIGAAVSAGGLGGAGGGTGTRDVSREGRMFRVDVALEEISPSVPDMSSVMVKWCKEL